ncbi:cadmium-translocating P-type ATPase [Azospirillum sp. RWY-5-1]|uniref:Cadmium-translocating P-type ATPase n=1 Tax=Azospirillum oleiclasticum TaxID=2735135 RepID=A0ABX2T7G2_9PROT|nr:heavy metal translocating P-type ATPase metal-binding domain-containing protein [Azospirillum oleiclasticum]NYZ13188.1 cadmium-translocating P-type ATPase [Azospirillum oleiclasticum]NYZ20139.1 cadmium-translocating P-type ATPase [Azospirillum oleiclasticum]
MADCLHCGQPLGAERVGEGFCCTGCAAAYDLVRGLGLERYYERRCVDPNARPLRPDEEAATIDCTAHARPTGKGTHALNLMVDGLQCGACVWLIETALRRQHGVVHARLNMTTRRLSVEWRPEETDANAVVGTLTRLGYRAMPFDPEKLGQVQRRGETELLRCMAVAGFAAGNVMLLSVSVWAGHSQGMGPATRDLMHWLSALICLPAIAFAVRPFARSALQALANRRTNMDVPITIGVLLATGMSLFETIDSGPHAYFDGAVMLLFFLLIGRYLDQRARGRARSAAEHMLGLGAQAVTVIGADGRTAAVRPEQVRPGDTVLVAVGERVPVDGTVSDGVSDLDTALITGETVPNAVKRGDRVFAGMLNLSAPLRLTVDAVGEGTLLAEIVRLMEVAEQGRARFVALADRVSRLYAPVVHLAALGTFLAWVFLGGVAWQDGLMNAVAVLIITCPCALALAVPVVQVIASGRLMRAGVLLKSATALERLAEIDTVVFDKTGTLTEGRPEPLLDGVAEEDRRLAASMAGASRHPLARALAAAVPGVPVATEVREVAGAGLLLDTAEGTVRLGSRRFTGAPDDAEEAVGPELWLARPGASPVRITFHDAPRTDAAAVIAGLTARGIRVALLSGDRRGAVTAMAERLGITDWQAERTPADKVEALAALVAQGRRVLMVGDGLNDAPALAAATVSMSPSTAVDVSQTAADAVFQGRRLVPILEAIEVARRSGVLVRQNIGIAIVYNVFAVPLAMGGMLTPLLAALAMSSSSLIVIANALRLGRGRVVKEPPHDRASLSDRGRPQPGAPGSGGVPVGTQVRAV